MGGRNGWATIISIWKIVPGVLVENYWLIASVDIFSLFKASLFFSPRKGPCTLYHSFSHYTHTHTIFCDGNRKECAFIGSHLRIYFVFVLLNDATAGDDYFEIGSMFALEVCRDGGGFYWILLAIWLLLRFCGWGQGVGILMEFQLGRQCLLYGKYSILMLMNWLFKMFWHSKNQFSFFLPFV